MNIKCEIAKNLIRYYNDIFIEIEERKVTFGEFQRASGRISQFLSNYNLQNPVLVIGHKNAEMLMIFYACFNMGIAYASIDTSTPLERILCIYKELDPSITFVCEKNMSLGVEDEISYNMLSMICKSGIIKTDGREKHLSDTAYIMFTSGTTGKPKGILISYEALFNFINWIDSILPEKRFTIINQSLFSFDISIFDFYYSLFRACKMICITRNNQHEIIDYIQGETKVLLFSTPSYIKKIIYENKNKAKDVQALKVLLIGGDYLDLKLARESMNMFKTANIYNLYGPTEATVVVSKVLINDLLLDEGIEEIPIDYTGNNIYVANENGEELGEGNIGEIIIRGKQLAIGYLGDKKQTQQKFIFNSRKERVYFTGDLGELKNGKIFFRGRKDMQCKINGYRIEILDVENNIREIPGIDDVLCILKKDKNSSYLEAEIILEKENSKCEQEIRGELKDKIPSYMIPKVINIVPHFQLNINGKKRRSKNAEYKI